MNSKRLLQPLVSGLLILYGTFSAYTSLGPLLGLPSMGKLIMPQLTLLAFTFALVHARLRLGCPRTLLLLGLSFGVSLLYESVGVATGWVYGPYHYTDLLGPRFLGLVPYLIPAAWFMMVYPAQVIAEGLLGDRLAAGWRRILGLAAASAVVMTAWDVIMDPIMVRMGFWVWEVEGGYFGVPLHNYAGWFVTTFTIYLLFRLIAPRLGGTPTRRPTGSFLRLPAWSYLITWASNTIAAFQMDLAGPALAGTFSVGAFALLGLFSLSDGQPSKFD